MNFARVGLAIVLAAVLALNIAGLGGCANQVPPSGGPRDSLPPVLVSVTPADSSINFSARRITFQFDEFVIVDDVSRNLLISPLPKVSPTVQARLRTVTVQLRDTLQPNTTYVFNFGDAIRDNNEGNPLRNFRYVFSTGPVIDSFRLSGQVIVSETGKVDTTLVAILHESLDDSAVINQRPQYVARLSSNGQFAFQNLPAGTFALYALKDEGGVYRYQSKSQLFAFADSSVVVQDQSEPILLYAYQSEEPKTPSSSVTRPTGVRGATTDRRLRFQTNLEGEQLDMLRPLEINFQAPLRNFDSSGVRFVDENFNPLTAYDIRLDTGRQNLKLTHDWKENTQYHLMLSRDFAEDTAGRKLLRDDTLSWRTKKTSDYGLVHLRFPNLDLTRNPVLQFVQGNEVVFSHSFTSKEFRAPLFSPGEYELRILYDRNGNGVWDPGNFFEDRRQPEIVEAVERRLTVKPNWDNEVDISL